VFGKTPKLHAKLFFIEKFIIQQRKLVADVRENSEKFKRIVETVA